MSQGGEKIVRRSLAIYNYKKDDYRIINASNREDTLRAIRRIASDLGWRNEHCVIKEVKDGRIQW